MKSSVEENIAAALAEAEEIEVREGHQWGYGLIAGYQVCQDEAAGVRKEVAEQADRPGIGVEQGKSYHPQREDTWGEVDHQILPATVGTLRDKEDLRFLD